MSRTEDGTIPAPQGGSALPVAIYIIYLVALFTAVPFFIGVILAYLFRSDSDAWVRNHLDHAISLFWRFVLGTFACAGLIAISIPLVVVLIGIPMIIVGVLGLVYLWFYMLIRCLRGIGAARNLAPYPGRFGFSI